MGAAGKMSGAMGAAFFVNLVGNLLLAKILRTAEPLGIWRSVQLFLQYTHFLNLGASHGLDRVGATMITRGQLVRYRKAMGASFGFSLVLPVIASIVLLCCIPFIAATGARLGAIALVFLIPLQQWQVYADLSLIFEKKFGLRARTMFSYTMLRIPLTLLLAWWIGLSGALIAFVVCTAWFAFSMWRGSEMGAHLSLHGRFARSMIRTGLPITLLAFGEIMVQTVDKRMVLLLGQETAMGLYSMAIFPLPMLMLLPTSLRDAMNVEIYDYARQKGDAQGVRALYSHTLQLIALGSPIVMGVVFFGVPWLIRWLLSEDIQASIPAVEMHAVMIYPLLIAQTGMGVIIALRLEVRSFAMVCLLALASAASCLFLAQNTSIIPAEIPGDPTHAHEQAIMRLVLAVHGCTWFLYAMFILTLNHWKFGLRPAVAFARSLVYLAPMAVAGVSLYGIQWLMERTSLPPYSFANAALSGLLYLVVCAPGLVYLEKRYGSVSGFFQGVGRRLKGFAS